MTKWIPLYIKCPLAVLSKQTGHLPLKLVLNNARWSFVQNRNCDQSVKDRAYQKLQKKLCNYLSRRYGSVIDEICRNGTEGTYVENAPIWVFWWQGAEGAPQIIRSCLEALRKNAGSHPVCVVDAKNYRDYIKVPEHIEQRLQKKTMSVTHFSDYVRMNLLAQHGGLWIDASVFVQKSLDPQLFEKPIWTLRVPGQDTANISGWNWTIGALGGWKGHVLFQTVEAVLSRYWAEHDIVADYFMMDCIVKTVYDRCSLVQKDIRAVQPNNHRFYWLQEQASRPLDEKEYQAELDSQTWMYKISWKGNYEEQTADGKETFFGRWKKDFGVG